MRWTYIILLFIAISSYSQNSTLRIHKASPEANSSQEWASINADIWVDAVEGDDNNWGTTSSTPIKTLSRLNEIIAGSSEGIKIAISDTVYYGTISITGKTGRFDDYYEIVGANKWGNGKPNIKGYQEIKDWIFLGNDLYSKKDPEADLWDKEYKMVSQTSTYKPGYLMVLSGLLIDGQQYGIAQTPDEGYYGIDVVSEDFKSWFTDTDLSVSPNEFQGAYAYIGLKDWVAHKVKITGNTSNTINLDTTYFSIYDMGEAQYWYEDVKYKIVNNTPDQHGEWKYDYSQKEIILYSETDPSDLSIYAPVGDSIISISNSGYVRISNINLWGGNFASVYVEDSDEIVIDNTNIYYPGHSGIMLLRNKNITIEHDSIFNGNDNGIYCSRSVHGSKTKISNCYIENLGEHEYFADVEGRHYMGILCLYNYGDFDIRYNHTRNTGYNGICWFNSISNRQPDSVIIYGNLIEDFCFHMHDGAGIYVYGENDYYKVIRKNIVMNSSTQHDFRSRDETNIMGIYLDQTASHWLADSNTIYNSARSLFNQSTATHNTYLYNTMVEFNRADMGENTQAGFYKAGTSNRSNHLTFKYNTVVVTDDMTGMASNWGMNISPTFDGMDIDYNRYFNPFRDDDKIIKTRIGDEGSNTKEYYYTLSEWKDFTGWEGNSTYNQANWDYGDVSGVKEDEFVWVFINWSDESYSFNLEDNTFKDMDGSDVIGSITLKPYMSCVMFYATKESLKTIWWICGIISVILVLVIVYLRYYIKKSHLQNDVHTIQLGTLD